MRKGVEGMKIAITIGYYRFVAALGTLYAGGCPWRFLLI